MSETTQWWWEYTGRPPRRRSDLSPLSHFQHYFSFNTVHILALSAAEAAAVAGGVGAKLVGSHIDPLVILPADENHVLLVEDIGVAPWHRLFLQILLGNCIYIFIDSIGKCLQMVLIFFDNKTKLDSNERYDAHANQRNACGMGRISN